LEKDEKAREDLEAKLKLLEEKEAQEQNEIEDTVPEEFGPGISIRIRVTHLMSGHLAKHFNLIF